MSEKTLLRSMPPSPDFLISAQLQMWKFWGFFVFFVFWLGWVFIDACGLSLVAESRGYSSFWCVGFSLQWLHLLRSTGSRLAGFSSCSTGAQ